MIAMMCSRQMEAERKLDVKKITILYHWLFVTFFG
jgi:hypothetical protein